mmetsp:Transcript_21580/g.46159  ORF Transcript_21580/g.46159 Transcript_21580/m.46159 type:complete len:91 (+) Transcript_21580:706-978(+)
MPLKCKRQKRLHEGTLRETETKKWQMDRTGMLSLRVISLITQQIKNTKGRREIPTKIERDGDDTEDGSTINAQWARLFRLACVFYSLIVP